MEWIPWATKKRSEGEEKSGPSWTDRFFLTPKRLAYLVLLSLIVALMLPIGIELPLG